MNYYDVPRMSIDDRGQKDPQGLCQLVLKEIIGVGSFEMLYIRISVKLSISFHVPQGGSLTLLCVHFHLNGSRIVVH